MRLLTLLFLLSTLASAKRLDFWPTIPFIRGADLCQYQNAYGQTRSEYMQEMVGLASQLMYSGAYGSEALDMLVTFQSLYERNISLAQRGRYLDVTLENTFRAYMDQYYRDLKPREKVISFTHIAPLVSIVRALSNNQRIGITREDLIGDLDYMIYGSYSYAPSCRGDILVTLTIVGKDGVTKNYVGQGKPNVVMSQIASKMFEDFQRTKFPSTISMGARNLTILGDLNGEVGKVQHPRIAKMNCEMLGARLPSVREYHIINSYGSWSGGVSLGNQANKWALSADDLFIPESNRTVWSTSSVNDRSCYYICVK
tara:strand:- start:45856 stop:46794 length:939 start_codon:yes stop_codon:yes gene_type:complete